MQRTDKMKLGIRRVLTVLLATWECQQRSHAASTESAISPSEDGLASFGMFEAQPQRRRLQQHRRSTTTRVQEGSLAVGAKRERTEDAAEEANAVERLFYSPLVADQSNERVEDNYDLKVPEEEEQRHFFWPRLLLKGQSHLSEYDNATADMADADGVVDRKTTKKTKKTNQQDKMQQRNGTKKRQPRGFNTVKNKVKRQQRNITPSNNNVNDNDGSSRSHQKKGKRHQLPSNTAKHGFKAEMQQRKKTSSNGVRNQKKEKEASSNDRNRHKNGANKRKKTTTNERNSNNNVEGQRKKAAKVQKRLEKNGPQKKVRGNNRKGSPGGGKGADLPYREKHGIKIKNTAKKTGVEGKGGAKKAGGPGNRVESGGSQRVPKASGWNKNGNNTQRTNKTGRNGEAKRMNHGGGEKKAGLIPSSKPVGKKMCPCPPGPPDWKPGWYGDWLPGRFGSNVSPRNAESGLLVLRNRGWHPPSQSGWGGGWDSGSNAGKSLTSNWNPGLKSSWDSPGWHHPAWGGGWNGRHSRSSRSRDTQGGWRGGWQKPPAMCECPTDPPTRRPTYPPTYQPTYPPTYAPTDQPTNPPTDVPTDQPTHSPTDVPTYPPTDLPTGSPTDPPTHPPTDVPTNSPTDVPTHPPTHLPTGSPTDPPTHPPTYVPTEAPTDIPSGSPSGSPTEAPTTSSPTVGPEECNWFYWGGEEGRGTVVGPDQEVPEFQPEEVIDVSAGSRHTFFIDEHGDAYVAGFIESFLSYQGHMGVERDLLSEGPNDFLRVPTVVIRETQLTDDLPQGGVVLKSVPAPKFDKVYAGAGAPGDSRDMHSLLIDAAGSVYTTGHNDKGQLCHGDLESRDVFRQVELPDDAKAAAVGLDFTLILLRDGRVFGCGSNQNGELGLGPIVAFAEAPTQIQGLGKIKDVSAGLNFGLYLEWGSRRVFGSGSNLFSQLCKNTDGDTVDYPMELAVKDVSQIMAGRESSYFLHRNGSAESCGRNDEGQLGDGTFVDSDSAARVDIPNNNVNRVRLLGSGPSSQSAFFVAGEDVVFAAGQNYRFQLGIGEINNPVSEVFPLPVEFKDAPHLHEIVKVSSSGTHTVAISCRIFTDEPTNSPTKNPTESPTESPSESPTGLPTTFPTDSPTENPTESPTESPSESPTGLPTTFPTVSPTLNPTVMPTTVPTENPTQSPTETPTISPTVAPTISPSELPTTDPTVSPTINPTSNPTLDPTESPTYTPTFSPTELPTIVTPAPTIFPTLSPTISPSVSPTESPTIMTPPPTVFPTMSPTITPTITPTISPTYLIPPTLSPTLSPSLSPTFSPTLVIANWYFWGAEEGRGNTLGEDQTEPEWILGEIQDVSAGSRHTFLIEAGGQAWAAGFIESDFGYRGHLGLGEVKDCGPKGDPDKLCEYENDPLPITTVIDASGKEDKPPRFKHAYAGVGVPADSGEMHSVLVANNGKVYITGDNNRGQLCLGDDRDFVNYFHEVPGIDNAVAAAVGIEFTLILLDNGDVYGCGSNSVGQIGQGQDTDISNVPVKIEDLGRIDQISTGLSFAIFLDKGKNRVWGTGGNLYWQQCGGTGGEPFQSVREIKFDDGGDIVQIETNRESSYFLFEDGKVRSCGRNDEGQLGNGDFINSESQKTPIVDVDLKKDVLRLGSGPSSQSVFFILEEEVYAAGLNDRHQLGINEIGSREFPVKVDFECEVEIEFVSSSGSHTVANGYYLNNCCDSCPSTNWP